MSITREQWLAAREDYIRGRGSLASVATRHNLKCGSVEKRAKREGWTNLRREFEAAQLAKLIPLPPPTLPPVPMSPDGAISESWLRERQVIHYQRNAEMLDTMRALLNSKLTASEKPGADELCKLISALGTLVSAEIALLGLNRRQHGKRRPTPPRPYPEPIPVAPRPVEQ